MLIDVNRTKRPSAPQSSKKTSAKKSVLKTASSWRKRRGNGTAVSHTPPIAPASIPSTSHQQQLLSHSVDKMFEEAELSGVLMLASRKLKEFPSNLAVKYDISDVISADLSDNRLNELPICICELASMETLRVRSTGLRSLPAAVQLLESLVYLDLSENQLSSLPIGLFSLRLQVLLLTGNRLESIPREVRHLADSIHELDVSCNRLRTIPADIALLKLLRVLNLRDNHLTRLPSELSRMELRVLDVSENEIGELPSELRHMSSLVELCTYGNPLTTPPATICSKGREHVFKWLRAQANCSENGLRQMDWSMNRPVSINATLRRGKYHDNGIDTIYRRNDRRSRAPRFNTLGGSDSGYASTVDEHRYSHEFQTPNAPGCLFGIDESLRSSTANNPDFTSYVEYDVNKAKCCEVVQQHQIASVSQNPNHLLKQTSFSSVSSSSVPTSSGGLLNEVMTAYNEKVLIGSSHSRAAVSSVCTPSSSHQSLVRSSPVYSTTSMLSSSYSSIPSISTSTTTSSSHRPQAIVSPMTSVNSSNVNSSAIVQSSASKETLLEGNEFMKTDDDPDEIVRNDTVTNGIRNGSMLSTSNSVTMDKTTDKSTDDVLLKCDSSMANLNDAIEKGDHFERNESIISFNKSLSSHASDSSAFPFSKSDIEMLYSMKKQQCRKIQQDTDQPKILSPVIEAPTSPVPNTNGTSNENHSTNSDASIAVRSSIVPESGCTTVRKLNSTASVSTAIKVPTAQSTRTSGSSSRGSSSLNSSRSSLASSRTIPALKRPTAGVHSTTARSAATTTTSHLSVTSKTTNKLSKTRDSLGLARNHLNGNANRTKATNSTAAFPDKKRIMHASDPTKTTTSSHSTIPTSITHNTSGVIDNMRKVLEQRLNVSLPHERDQLATSLADGIHLCNFVNSVRARSVPTVLTSSSPTAPLSSPKCRRNIENFLSACRRIGVPEMSLSLCSDIVERRNLLQTARTVLALNKIANSPKNNLIRTSESRRITNV